MGRDLVGVSRLVQARADNQRVSVPDQQLTLEEVAYAPRFGELPLEGQGNTVREFEPGFRQRLTHAWLVDVDRGYEQVLAQVLNDAHPQAAA